MAEKEKTSSKRSWGRDMASQAIHDLMPGLARTVVNGAPASWFRTQSIEQVIKWGTPVLSILMKRVLPDGWDLAEEATTEMVAELRRAALDRMGKGDANASTTGQETPVKGEIKMNDQLALLDGGVDDDGPFLPSLHVRSCDRVKEQIPVGRGKMIRNPAVKLVDWDEGVAIQEARPEAIERCACVDAVTPLREKRNAPAAGKSRQKKPAEIFAELTDAERARYQAHYAALANEPARQKYVRDEIEARLTSIEELRGILELAEMMPLDQAVGLLKDVVWETAGKVAKWVGQKLASGATVAVATGGAIREDLRQAATENNDWLKGLADTLQAYTKTQLDKEPQPKTQPKKGDHK